MAFSKIEREVIEDAAVNAAKVEDGTIVGADLTTGFITNATNNDEPKTIINVMGKNFINSPIIPGQSASGTKAARVVAVEEIIGQATSPAPYLAASNGL